MAKAYIHRRIYERNRWLRSDGKPNFKTTIHRVVPELEPVIDKNVPTIYPTSSILQACEKMSSSGQRMLPITSPTSLLQGVTTAMDIIELLSGPKCKSLLDKDYSEISIYDVLNMNIKVVMREPITVNIKSKLSEVLEFMVLNNLGALPVVDDYGVFRGLFTESTLVRLLSGKYTGIKVADVMTREVIMTNINRRLGDAMSVMISSGIRRLPVLNTSGEVTGVLTWKSIIDLIGKHKVFEKLKSGTLSDFINIPLSNVELSKPIVVGEDEDIGDVAEKLKSGNEDYALVAINSKLKGIITERDILYGLLVVRGSGT